MAKTQDIPQVGPERHASSSRTITGSTSMPHYHIRWSNSTLDWEAFSTSEEAEAQAQQLVRLGESYIIEPADGDCERCSSLPHLSGRNLAIQKEVSEGQEAVHINSSPST